MNPQPTIFISSIISEFYDLRGALKYFLGKSGFRVLMSEEPDFGADCGQDSLDNCKQLIERSDYYLLIIGNKPGTIFEIGGKNSSVTFEEFRHYVELIRSGKHLNFIAFVRQQAWEYYINNNTDKIDPLQIEFIDELLKNSSIEDKKIGRWRYTFNRFADIISVLETNQNGLFLDATRKSSIYRNYIKREIYDVLKTLLEKSSENGEIRSINQIVDLPKVDGLDLFHFSKIEPKTAAKIHTFLVVLQDKDSLIRKINRIFNYIAQGEFSNFDTKEEMYVLPEYIKLTIQSLEILEKVFDNSKNFTLLEDINKRDTHNFLINQFEFDIVKSLYDDLNIVIAKLINLIRCFSKNWVDLESHPDSFYSYGKVSGFLISDDEVTKYADEYFKS